MTVQFIFGHGVVKVECTAFISRERPICFLSSMGVMPSGNPAMKVKRVLYEWRHMLWWLLYLSKASIFQTFLYCLSHFSSEASRLYFPAPSPPRLSHLSAQITVSSVLCQNWQTICHPNPLNCLWHFLYCRCIFLFQSCLSLHCTVSAISISYTSLARFYSLWMSQIILKALPVHPELLQSSPDLCPFCWQDRL